MQMIARPPHTPLPPQEQLTLLFCKFTIVFKRKYLQEKYNNKK